MYQDSFNTVHVVATVLGNDQLCDVYFCSIELQQLEWDDDLGRIQGFDVAGTKSDKISFISD